MGCSEDLKGCSGKEEDKNDKAARAILTNALKSPLKQILKNAGLDYKKILTC